MELSKELVLAITLEVNERLAIMLDFTGSILPNWSSISCCTFENKQKKTGFALVIVISNSRGNILYNYNVKIRMHMGNWQYFMILLGVHYQVEIPFPALHLKKKREKTGNGI